MAGGHSPTVLQPTYQGLDNRTGPHPRPANITNTVQTCPTAPKTQSRAYSHPTVPRAQTRNTRVGDTHTFEIAVYACKREPRVPELEHDVRLVEQRRQHALKLQHVSREPRRWRRQRRERDVRQHDCRRLPQAMFQSEVAVSKPDPFGAAVEVAEVRQQPAWSESAQSRERAKFSSQREAMNQLRDSATPKQPVRVIE